MPGSLEFCNEENGNSQGDGTIDFCDQADEDLDFCDAAPLTLTGTDAPTNGSTYVAEGGVQPYTFAMSCGSISSEGVVLGNGGCCGPGWVSVTDSRGSEAIIDVRMPLGVWNYQSYIYGPNPYSCGGWSFLQYCFDDNAAIRHQYQYGCQWDSCQADFYIAPCRTPPSCAAGWEEAVRSIAEYKWECS